MLVVGTDSYCTLDEAETYLSDHYISTDSNFLAWSSLSAGDRETLLRRAATVIDRQILVGFRALPNQTMEFPRAIYTNETYSPYDLNANWTIQTTVPDVVKYAQCEIAIDHVNGLSARMLMQREGVKSFSLGKLSETYTGTKNAIESYEARVLLSPFVAGGVSIV